MPKQKRKTLSWKEVLNELRTRIGDESVQRWFSATRLGGVRNGTATITVPNNIYRFWIEANYEDKLLSALQALDPTIHKFSASRTTRSCETQCSPTKGLCQLQPS